ncbi:hypothetical protein SALWKB12_2056 [Snodgrassella communis]|nr:hypothetical protein SALWKB12_2056 [Snodgrassella communis]
MAGSCIPLIRELPACPVRLSVVSAVYLIHYLRQFTSS